MALSYAGDHDLKKLESTRPLPKDALLCKVLISFSCQIVERVEDFSLFIPSNYVKIHPPPPIMAQPWKPGNND